MLARMHAHAREDYGTNQSGRVSSDKELETIYMLAHENSRSLYALSIFSLHTYIRSAYSPYQSAVRALVTIGVWI
jgi:hypothetical protein